MRLRRWIRWLSWPARQWRVFQVELQGQYSHAQLQRFEHYQATTSLWRVAAVCVFTPVPMLLAIVAMGLLPLEPVERGALGSPHVWLRHWLTMILMSLCVLQQLRQHLPEFQINALDCVLITLISSTCDVGSVIALAAVVEYPLPFTVLLGSIPWYFVFVVVFVVRKRQIIHDRPDSLRRMGKYILMSLCQLAMTMIYPVYSYVFEHLSSLQQTAFVLLLPLIKLLTKNWICHTLPDSDDAKPEAVVFNVEVFHSLFVSLCMGNTTSTRTVVVLMAVDLVEAWVSFHDVLAILSVLTPVSHRLKLPPEVQLHRYPSLAKIATELHTNSGEASTQQRAPDAVALWWKRHTPKKLVDLDVRFVHLSAKMLKKGRVSPAPTTTDLVLQVTSHNDHRAAEHVATAVNPAVTAPTSIEPRPDLLARARNSLAPAECALLLRQTEKLLFVTEFIVLIEYTEVVMPTVYNILVWAFYSLPNREYYTFLEGICSRAALVGIVANVQLYAAFELLSLAAMALVLWRKVGLSVLHQLAFVLEDRAANIQSKLLLWVVYIMQNAIVQLGCDYSFRFEWLRQAPGSAPLAFGTRCPD